MHEPAADDACTCPDCGRGMARLGEDVTEMLDYVPGYFQVIRHMRPKYICTACDAITQPPAPAMPHAARPGPPHTTLTRDGQGRAGGPATFAHPAGGEIRRSLAAVSPERDLRACRTGAGSLDAVRLGKPGSLAAGPCGGGHRRARLCGREDPRRRHHGADAGTGPRADQDWAAVGLRARRTAILRLRDAGRHLLLQSRLRPRTSRLAPGRLPRSAAG